MMYCTVCVCLSECTHTCQDGARRDFSPLLYRPLGVDSVTVTFTSWPWGKKEMATLTMDKEGVVMVVLMRSMVDQGMVADMDLL